MLLERLIVKLDADLSGLDRGFLEGERNALRFGNTVDQLGRKLTMGLTVPLTAVGALSVGAAVKMESLTRGLRAISENASAAQREMKLLEGVARLPGLGFRDAIQGSIRLQNAGASAEMARDSLMEFGNAIALVGGGKAELDGVTLALTQMLSSGQVFGEEIRQLQERVPQIRQAMIEAFGTARTEDIQKMGISAEVFLTKINAVLAKLPRMSGGALNVLENLQDSVERAGVAFGEALLPVVLDAAEGLEGLAKGFRALDDGTTRWVASIGGAVALLGPLTIGLNSVAVAAVAVNAAFKTGLLTSLLGAGGLVVGLTLGIAALGEWALSSAAARRESERLRDAWRGLSEEGLQARESSIQTQIDETIAAIKRYDRAAEVSTGNLRGNFERQGREARRQLISLQGELERTKAALAALEDESGGEGSGGMLGPLPRLDINAGMLRMLEERADSLSEKAEGIRLDLQFEQDADAAKALRAELTALLDELERVNTEIARQRLEGPLTFRAAPANAGQDLDSNIPGLRGLPGIGEGIGNSRFNINRFTDPKARANIAKDALEDTAEGLDGVAQGARLAAPLLGRFGGTLSEIVGGLAQGGFMGIGSAIVSGLGAAIGGLFGGQDNNALEENTKALRLNTDAILSGLRGTPGLGDTIKMLQRSLAIIDEAGGQGSIRPSAGMIETLESLNLTVPDPDDIKAWRQVLDTLQSDVFGGFAGGMKALDLRASLLDLGAGEEFGMRRDFLAGSLGGSLGSQIGGLEIGDVGGFASGILDQVEAGTFDFSQLPADMSLDAFLDALSGLESLGDAAFGASDELGKLTDSLVNAPRGFKAELARFDATDARGRDASGRTGGPVRAGGVNVYGGVHIKADRGDDGAALYDKFVRELERRVARGDLDELMLLERGLRNA